MAATIRASHWTGAGPTGASAEGGAKFNREETLAGTSAPIPKPTATGTNYSWHKPLSLEVTGTDAGTSTSNRRIHRGSAPAAGLTMWYRDDGDTYQRGNSALTDNATTDDAAPSGFTAMPSSATQFDSGSDANSATGRSGDYVSVALGVSNLYVGGAGSAVSLPNIVFTYDES